MSGRIIIGIEAGAWQQAFPDFDAAITGAAQLALAETCADAATGEISIQLTDDAGMRELNAAWRGLDKPTNVLSFPAIDCRAGEVPQSEFPGVPLALGDIAFGYEIIAVEAAAAGKSFGDHLRHLTIHGVLHLLGYDHIEEADAEIMEGLEVRILAILGIADPYAAEPVGELL